MTNEDTLLDRLIQQKTSRPAADVYAPVKDWYKQTFGVEMPVKNIGASDFERKVGHEHSRSFDVGLSPNTPQGQQLLKYLDSQGIPYSAFAAAVNKGGRVIATGPHIHVGPPSKDVGSPTADDDLLDRLIQSKDTTPQGIAPPPTNDGEQLAKDIDWHFGPATLDAFHLLPADQQQSIARRATQLRVADDAKRKRGEPIIRSEEWQLQNRQKLGLDKAGPVRDELISQMTRANLAAQQTPEAQAARFKQQGQEFANLPWWKRGAITGITGIAEAGGGLARLAGKIGIPGATSMSQATAAMGQDIRGRQSEAAKINPPGLLEKAEEGLISYAPLAMGGLNPTSLVGKVVTGAGKFGGYVSSQAYGRGESAGESLKEGAKAAPLGALLHLPKSLVPFGGPLVKSATAMMARAPAIYGLARAEGATHQQALDQTALLTGFQIPELIGAGIGRGEKVTPAPKGVPDIDTAPAPRESAVKPTFLRNDAGEPIARVLNPEEVAAGAKPRVRLIHQADTQPRDPSGKFTSSPTVRTVADLGLSPEERLNAQSVSTTQPASEPKQLAPPATQPAGSPAQEGATQVTPSPSESPEAAARREALAKLPRGDVNIDVAEPETFRHGDTELVRSGDRRVPKAGEYYLNWENKPSLMEQDVIGKGGRNLTPAAEILIPRSEWLAEQQGKSAAEIDALLKKHDVRANATPGQVAALDAAEVRIRKARETIQPPTVPAQQAIGITPPPNLSPNRIEPITGQIAHANYKIEALERRLQETKMIKQPGTQTLRLQRDIIKQLAIATHERNLLLDAGTQAAIEGRSKKAVLAERRGLGLLGKADHPIADQIVNEEVNAADVLDTPIAITVMEDLNEANQIITKRAVAGSGVNPRVAERDTGGKGIATEKGLAPPPNVAQSFSVTETKNLLESEYAKAKSMLKLQGAARDQGAILQEVSRSLREKLAQDPSNDLISAVERSLPELFSRIAKEGKVSEEALRELWERQVSNAPSRLSRPSTSRVAMPDVPSDSTSLLKPPSVAGERQFPKSAAAAGLPDATDLTYAVNTDVGAVERANERLARDGDERVASDIRNASEPSKDDIVAGSILAHRLTAEGDVAAAVDVVDDLAVKLTNAGQTVQAASLISRLSPEGVLLAAQRRLPAGDKLTTEQAALLVKQAAEVRAAEAKVVELQRELEKLKGNSGEAPLTPRSTRARIGTLQERLAKLETEARARLAARVGVGKGSETGASTIPLDIADYVIIGAAKLARKGITLAQWTDEMVTEFGETIRPHIKALYRDSYQIYDEHRQQFLQESRERSARRAEPNAPNLQAVINSRLDAQTLARKARLELARTFTDLTKTPIQKVGSHVVDALNLSRALVTSLDLSGGMRQGKMGLLRHPKIFLNAFLKQFKALSTDQYERMISERELDPSYKYVRRFGLDLTSTGMAEEPYQSAYAHKIPLVKHSEQAYNTMLDELRFGWFKDYMKNTVDAGFDPEKPADFQAFKEGAQLINNATGRGNLGRLQGATPVLNTAFFSPRFWASRLKLLTLPFDPRTYTQMSRPARVEAFKTLFAFTALVSSQLALAKLSGAKVGTDPDDPDFLKARWGPVHVDFSAGFQNHIRAALRLTKAIASEKPQSSPAEILGTYARSKESPNASLIHDLFFSKKKGGYGTDFKGDPTASFGVPGNRWETNAVGKRLVPMAFQDAIEAYQQLGWKGVGLVGPPSVLGEGMNVYQPKTRGTASPPKKRGITPPPKR